MTDGAGYFDWHHLNDRADGRLAPPASRTRLLTALVGFLALVVVVYSRVTVLEWASGEAYREVAARPLVHRHELPGIRGRILAGDGTVLAHDEMAAALSLHYRYLEEPPNERFLRRKARARLSKSEQKEPGRIAQAEAQFLVERAQMHRRLAALCSLTQDEWDDRRAEVQRRVERIARLVNARRQAEYRSTRDDDAAATASDVHGPDDTASWWQRAQNAVFDALLSSQQEPPPQSITVAEELEYHVIVTGLDLEVVAEIEEHPDRYSGVEVTYVPRRSYPAGELAAHLVGHLGVVEEEELKTDSYHARALVGRLGIERRYEGLLRATPGNRVELSNHRGKILSSYIEQEPAAGRDVILSVNVPLQRTAEALLRSALTRRPAPHANRDAATSGGAVVVMDVRTGAVLAAASEPGFDPNAFSRNNTDAVTKLLTDAGGPMFDRVTRMALPPGSVFKPLTAIALLESGVDPHEPYFCRGYLHQPDRWRCQIYQRFGQGHESVGLIDALAYSCNVYFFHHAGQLGPDPLADWAGRVGFGRPTGIDLPGESGGFLPTPRNIRSREGHTWREGDTRAVAVGQGSLTATPLQIVRLMAAVANGGYLVTPHVVRGVGLVVDRPRADDTDGSADSESAASTFPDEIEVAAPRRIEGLSRRTLATIREGLERVVAAPEGTAHDTVYLDDIAIAGKTGTAQSGKDREDHAWFAGYVPADAPKVAFVVVLEHAGDGGAQAGPVAQRLVMRMKQLGYFGARRESSAVIRADFEGDVEE